MANPYRPETLRGMAATRRLQIATLIGDLWWSVEVLTADIEHEEMHSGVRNVANPNYPVLARSLKARRENLGATIASLEALTGSAPKRSKKTWT